ncbi:hypothetical protein FQN54_005711 [Arachnomyces sp. PD_36]|nr:hypothetical protein FQN54_005711 [Arachnomyces sp. PD_36]
MMILWFPDVFPTELVALDAAFLLIGGGNAVIIGILLSMISDVFPEDKRATAFMRLQVSGLVGHLVSPALSSAMMASTGPWPVMLVAIACLIVAAIGFLFVPETLSHKTRNEDEAEQENQPSDSQGPFLRTLDAIKKSLSILNSPSLILLLIICLLATPFTAAVLQFLVQFVSKRYEVLIRDTGYIQSAYGFAQIIQALLLLPWVSTIMLKDTTLRALRMANEQERDLALAKYSFCFALLGFVVLGATPSLALFIVGLLVLALGSGYSSLVHSIMSLYVDPLHQSQLFCLVGMVEVIGTLFGAPMLAGLFTMGIRLGGGWIGLPYYGLAALALLCIGVISFVRVPKHAAVVDASEQLEDPEESE